MEKWSNLQILPSPWNSRFKRKEERGCPPVVVMEAMGRGRLAGRVGARQTASQSLVQRNVERYGQPAMNKYTVLHTCRTNISSDVCLDTFLTVSHAQKAQP